MDRRDGLWVSYQDALVRAYDAAHDPAAQAKLREQAEVQARQRFAFLRQAPRGTVDQVVHAEADKLKRERMGTMPEEDFRAFRTAGDLRAALIERHSFDPLCHIDARDDMNLLNPA